MEDSMYPRILYALLIYVFIYILCYMFYNDATLSELNSANNSSSYVSKYIILWWKLQMAQNIYSSMI